MKQTFNILIVDDKELDRNGICYLIRQYDLPLNPITASSGKEALEILNTQTVDILFTDIRMPEMDGHQLIAIAKEIHSHLKVVIFSSYDSFEYAHKAMDLGITTYLLKPIKIDKFIKTMKKIINTLMHEYFHHVTNVIYDILIDDKETENPAVVDMPGCLFLLDFVQPFFNLRDNNPILPSSDKDMLKIPLNEYQCLFVSSSPALAKDYIEELFQYLDGSNRRFIILYGGQYDSIKQMKTVFHEMESYCSCKFYITQNKIIYMDSLPDTTHELDLIEIWNLCVQIGKLVNRGELAQAEDNLDIVFRKLQEHIRIPISIAKSACNEIAKHCLLRSDIKQSTFIQYLQEIEECTDINELKNIAAGIIHLNSPVDVETSVIQQAIELIHQNYMHNISLESIAAQVYLSPCYFSYLFKKITGTNFIKYLTAYRVEKAKDLLRTTRLKIVDICEQVGYSNSSYFCQIFHNHCGMTPIQYRENKL